ncbi:WecB/TagA/CpsF family glycosyltransferase [Pedobacter immunditicola]|uniref:WecB/TagA/CpsF family glycosyltransferase n=1 Tax=Pedobacter immunditicola TaxID=3133440 RepID=UPI0030A12344
MPNRLPKKRIISINVSNGTYKQFVSAIMHNALAKISSYVCVANVHMLLEAYDSLEFRKVVNSAYLVTPDGMPVAKSFQILHQQQQERVDGMSLLPNLLSTSEEKGLSVYFYGSTQEMLDQTAAYIRQNYPKLNISGLYSPPFRDLSEVEMDQIATKITNSGANIIFVVLGCPKQEKWMHAMKGKIPAIMIGIGGALPVLIGLQKRAPEWMQKNSLEWLYRLKQEPTRLFIRYFRTNNLFMYLLAKEQLKKTVKKNKWRVSK